MDALWRVDAVNIVHDVQLTVELYDPAIHLEVDFRLVDVKLDVFSWALGRLKISLEANAYLFAFDPCWLLKEHLLAVFVGERIVLDPVKLDKVIFENSLRLVNCCSRSFAISLIHVED